MDLSTLVKMSNTYGSNPAYVLAGGGNTSVKDDTTLYVKGSGTQLATIKAEEFVKMDRARLNEIMKTVILAPECLGGLLNAKTAEGATIYNTAVAYPIGVIFAIAMLAVFLHATKKAAQKA